MITMNTRRVPTRNHLSKRSFMTGRPIEVLLLKDSPSDAELTVEPLRDAKTRNKEAGKT